MTNSVYKEFSEFYITRHGDINTLTVVTRNYNALSCIYFIKNIKEDLRNNYDYKFNLMTSDLNHIIAEYFTKKYGITTLNYIETLSDKAFTYNVVKATSNNFTVLSFKPCEIYLANTPENVTVYNSEEEKNYKNVIDNMQVCETVEDIFKCILNTLTCNSTDRVLPISVINNRIDFINAFYQYVYNKLEDTVLKTEQNYVTYYPIYSWFKYNMSLDVKYSIYDPYKPAYNDEYVFKQDKFNKIIELAKSVQFKYKNFSEK